MINYSEVNIFNKKVNKCLTYDPFNSKFEIYKLETKKKYYDCSFNCFELYDNLPPFSFHYELSCACIKKCYEEINKN